MNYHSLNKVTVKNRYPLPLMSELSDRVTGATVFTKLKIKNGNHLFRMKKGDEGKTAFHTRYRLVIAPSTFLNMGNKVVRELLEQGVVVYVEDIRIYSCSQPEREILVSTVLQRLQEEELAVSLDK